jgi:hypothetical protein
VNERFSEVNPLDIEVRIIEEDRAIIKIIQRTAKTIQNIQDFLEVSTTSFSIID